MEYDLLYNKPDPRSLAHEGIPGMSWGKRNGPPYPLGSKQLSSKEKKKGGVSISAKIRDGIASVKEKAAANAKASADKKVEKANRKKTIAEAKEAAAEAKAKTKYYKDKKISNQDKMNASIDSSVKEKEPKVIKTTNKKKISKMSNADLMNSIDRLQQEENYKKLMNSVYGNKGTQYLKEQMGKAATDTLTSTMKEVGVKLGTRLAANAIKKATGIDINDSPEANNAAKAIKDATKEATDSIKKAFEDSRKAAKSSEEKTENKAKEKTEAKAKEKSSKTETASSTVEGEGTSHATFTNRYSGASSSFMEGFYSEVVPTARLTNNGHEYGGNYIESNNNYSTTLLLEDKHK